MGTGGWVKHYRTYIHEAAVHVKCESEIQWWYFLTQFTSYTLSNWSYTCYVGRLCNWNHIGNTVILSHSSMFSPDLTNYFSCLNQIAIAIWGTAIYFALGVTGKVLDTSSCAATSTVWIIRVQVYDLNEWFEIKLENCKVNQGIGQSDGTTERL